MERDRNKILKRIKLTEEQKKIIKQVLWDYDITAEEFYAVLKGKIEKAGFITKEWCLARLLGYQTWYSVLKILAIEEILDIWNEQVKKLVRVKEIIQGMDYAYRLLRKEILSTTE